MFKIEVVDGKFDRKKVWVHRIPVRGDILMLGEHGHAVREVWLLTSNSADPLVGLAAVVFLGD